MMSGIEKNLLDKISSERIFQNLNKMIKIPSISGNEKGMVDFLSKRLRKFGLTPNIKPLKMKEKIFMLFTIFLRVALC